MINRSYWEMLHYKLESWIAVDDKCCFIIEPACVDALYKFPTGLCRRRSPCSLSIDVTIKDDDKAFVLLNVSCVMLVEDDFGE